jgi:hypothetical protein
VFSWLWHRLFPLLYRFHFFDVVKINIIDPSLGGH